MLMGVSAPAIIAMRTGGAGRADLADPGGVGIQAMAHDTTPTPR